MSTTELPASFVAATDRAVRGIDRADPVEQLAEHAQVLARAMMEHGDRCAVGVNEDFNDLECRLTHFVWAERAKHFLLLYRDVQLQLQIASLLARDGQADENVVSNLYRRSRETLEGALEDWNGDYESRLQALQRNERQRKKQLASWKLQHNPWPIYRNQLKEIAEQSRELSGEYTTLSKETERFADLRDLLERGMTASSNAIERANRRAMEIEGYIREESQENGRPGAIAAKLEDYISEDAPPPRLDQFTNAVNAKIAGMAETMRVTVGADAGLLRYKEVNFRRATSQWVSAEVLPLLYEMWELSEQIDNGLNVAMVNVRNRALLLANDANTTTEAKEKGSQLGQPFSNFLKKTGERSKEYQALREQLEGMIERDLRLTSVYRPEPGFLPLPIQTGINAFTRRQGRVVTGIREWLAKHVTGVNNFLGDATREEKLSVSERTVRVIRQRTVSPDNSAYTNILMTKGYIGESFLVGRDAETQHMAQLVKDWKSGYRGAVMLTGRRLAGKTLFGELVTNRFFPNRTIRLRPNSPLTVEGRRTRTTGNLGEALSFIQKYTVQSRPLVWIDDLETWWDADHTLAANVRSLGEHIDDYSGRIFYLVATTNAVFRHLDRFLEVDRVFQSEINLDRFSLTDMQRAVLIRHGATHKVMVNREGEQISEAAFDSMIKRIYRSSDGNVGETINKWAYYTHKYDEESVYHTDGRRYVLPNFLSPDTATLLTTILLEKRTQDYRLSKLFGPAYQERYRSILQRLVRVGVVTRNNDGSLEITESIVNDVGRLLEAEDYLAYSK